MYKLFKENIEGTITCVIRLSDGAAIAISPDNTDYQAYLKWVADGNTPEAAE